MQTLITGSPSRSIGGGSGTRDVISQFQQRESTASSIMSTTVDLKAVSASEKAAEKYFEERTYC